VVEQGRTLASRHRTQAVFLRIRAGSFARIGTGDASVSCVSCPVGDDSLVSA